MLLQNPNFGQKRKFDQKSNFLVKTQILG